MSNNGKTNVENHNDLLKYLQHRQSELVVAEKKAEENRWWERIKQLNTRKFNTSQ